MYQSDDSHREHVVDEIGEYINEKYLKGQKAHGGHLWRKNLTPHAIEEAADLCVYLFTKREQEALSSMLLQRCLIDMERIKKEELSIHNIQVLGAILMGIREVTNILTIGNPEGIEEEEFEI